MPTEKFTAELEADRQKFELLLAEKNEQEMEYEEKLKAAEERTQAQLSALDTAYQAKIMAEVERYQVGGWVYEGVAVPSSTRGRSVIADGESKG
jgi:hypothetical protein